MEIYRDFWEVWVGKFLYYNFLHPAQVPAIVDVDISLVKRKEEWLTYNPKDNNANNIKCSNEGFVKAAHRRKFKSPNDLITLFQI